MDTSLLPAPSRNLPAVRTSKALVVRTPAPATPRLGAVGRAVLYGTVIATPFAGLLISLGGWWQ